MKINSSRLRSKEMIKASHEILFVAVTAMFLATQAKAVLYWGRPYDPNLQRWIQRDPIGEQGGINLYDYAGNSPLSKVDPLGMEGNPVSGLGGAWNSNPYGGSGSFYSPGYLYQPEIQPPLFNSSFSFGITGTVNADAGMFFGAGGTYSGGIGFFYNPQDGFSIGSFQSSGGFAGGWDSTLSVKSPCNLPSFVFGGYGGLGGGLFFSNAGSPNQLYGAFDQGNFNSPVSLSYGQSGKIGIFSITGGPGDVSSISIYPTYTWSTAGFNLTTGQPTPPPNQ